MGGWQKLGVSYPRGGPQNTALAMVEAIEQRGGAVFVRAPVASILTDAATGEAVGVVMATGQQVRAKRVVSALGYRATERLLTNPAVNTPLSRPLPLKTAQSAGFVMANIGLRGSASQLGISCANLWIQPSNHANGYDALQGEQVFFADPLGVHPSLIPVGITFPSAKEESFTAAATGTDATGEVPHHTCQILALAEYDWFKQHLPKVSAPRMA